MTYEGFATWPNVAEPMAIQWVEGDEPGEIQPGTIFFLYPGVLRIVVGMNIAERITNESTPDHDAAPLR